MLPALTSASWILKTAKKITQIFPKNLFHTCLQFVGSLSWLVHRISTLGSFSVKKSLYSIQLNKNYVHMPRKCMT